MKWTDAYPTSAGWYWFESEPLNIGARIVRVIEDCGQVMIDDSEFQLYDNVDAFPGARWSDTPVPEPEGGIEYRVNLPRAKRLFRPAKPDASDGESVP